MVYLLVILIKVYLATFLLGNYTKIMKIGYARVSTQDQNLESQLDALNKHGCDRIYSEKVSSGRKERPELEAALEYMREGDVLIVMKLDRLGRSLKELVKIVEDLHSKNMHFQTLEGHQFDTSNASGKLTFQIFAALAEFERNIIRERTTAGLKAAAARGRKGGQPPKINDSNRDQAIALLTDPEVSINKVCETLGVTKRTLYNHFPDGKATKRKP